MPVQLRKPKAVILDLLGTASKSGFLEQILFPFLKGNLEGYINSHWKDKDFIRIYNKIVMQSVEYHKSEPSTPVVLSHENSSGKQSLLTFISFVTDNGINCPAVTQLRFQVWFEGYQHNKLRTPIYSDVPNQMRRWHAEGIKFYVFSNTWVSAQKALLKNTNHGDLTNMISGHYDNEFGVLSEAESWRRLCNEIKESPADVLFLTKSPVEAKAASDAGIQICLVLTHRHNVKAVSHDDRRRFPYVRTFNDLTWLDGQGVGETTMATATTNELIPNSVTTKQSDIGSRPTISGSSQKSSPSNPGVGSSQQNSKQRSKTKVKN